MLKGVGETEQLVKEPVYIWILEMKDNDRWRIGEHTY